MPVLRLLAAVCLTLSLAIGVARATPEPYQQAQGGLAFTVYGARDGLSDEVWTAIGFDRDGFVWAGSASSLARFDGYRWVPWPEPAARSLVRDLRRDPQGTLWALFEREGWAAWDGRAWTLRGGSSDLLHRISPWTDARGAPMLSAGTQGGFQQLRDGAWVFEPGPPGQFLTDVETTRTLFGGPRQWALGDQLWHRAMHADGSHGEWQRFRHPQLDEVGGQDLVRTEDASGEALWVLTYGNGLLRLRDDGLRVWRGATGELPSEALYVGRTTRDEAGASVLWVASRGGLLRVAGERVTVHDRSSGLPSDAVRALDIQRDVDGVDLLWVATEGGIARAALGSSPWQTVSLLGARFNGVFGVLVEDAPGGGERLWVATGNEGIGVRDNGHWRYLTPANGGLPVEGARQVWRFPGVDGRPWRLIGIAGGLLEADDALRMRRIASPWDGTADVPVHALSREHAGAREYWFATRASGIHRLRGGRWTRHPVAGAETIGAVYRLEEHFDRNGRSWLWAATQAGIARHDGTAWVLLDPPGLPVDGFRAATPIDEAGRSVLWLGATRSGVLRLDIDDPLQPRLLVDDAPPPAPDPTVYTILADRRGRIYVCTNNGVQQLSRAADGGWREQVFRRRDGLAHDECNTNAQMIDAQDRYWVGTLAGLSLYDPAIQAPGGRTRAKPVRITALRIDGEQQALDAAKGAVIAPGGGELRIDFTLLSGQREQETTYRTRLAGLEAAFGRWGGEHSRTWARMPPGRYALEVEARDFAGTISRGEPLPIVVQPHWWERAAVQAASAALLLLVAFALAFAWHRNLRVREQQLRREVALRTAELSDANDRLTSLSYVDPLTGIANRRRLMESLDVEWRRARALARPVGVILIDVDHFKAYNDRFGHLVGDQALAAIARALQCGMRPQDLLARFGGEEFMVLVAEGDLGTAQRIAGQLRADVAALPPALLGNEHLGLTLSLGVASRTPAGNERVEDLLHEADAALYRAKQDGRNCVRVGRARARGADAPDA